MIYHVSHGVTLEVEAENADLASRKLYIVPSMKEYENVGKVVRTQWLTELQYESAFNRPTEQPTSTEIDR